MNSEVSIGYGEVCVPLSLLISLPHLADRPSHNLPRSEEKVEVLFHSLANMVKHALGMNKDFWKEFDTMDLTLDSFHTRVKQVVRESGIPDKHRQKV